MDHGVWDGGWLQGSRAPWLLQRLFQKECNVKKNAMAPSREWNTLIDSIERHSDYDSAVEHPESALNWLLDVQRIVGTEHASISLVNLQLCKHLGTHKLKTAISLACLELYSRWKGPDEDSGEDGDEGDGMEESNVDTEDERNQVLDLIAKFHNYRWTKLYHNDDEPILSQTRPANAITQIAMH